MVNWDEQWAEILALVFIVLGFIISILLSQPIYSYLSVVLAGFVAGRVFYIKRFKEPILPFVLIIVGFLVGYLMGSLWASRFWILVLFGVTFGLSYYLHLKKILVIFKSKQFVK